MLAEESIDCDYARDGWLDVVMKPENMAHAEALAALIAADPRFELKQQPETAVLNWRMVNGSTDTVLPKLAGTSSRTQIDGALWARQVAANPNADIARIWAQIASAS